MQKGNIYRLYPTNDQIKRLEKAFKINGIVWNWGLDLKLIKNEDI